MGVWVCGCVDVWVCGCVGVRGGCVGGGGWGEVCGEVGVCGGVGVWGGGCVGVCGDQQLPPFTESPRLAA